MKGRMDNQPINQSITLTFQMRQQVRRTMVMSNTNTTGHSKLLHYKGKCPHLTTFKKDTVKWNYCKMI